MSTSQSALTMCGWGVKAGIAYSSNIQVKAKVRLEIPVRATWKKSRPELETANTYNASRKVVGATSSDGFIYSLFRKYAA